MKVAITGASGFIGTQLSHYLTENGHHVTPLTRIHFSEAGLPALNVILADADAVINLAGASIQKRWTKAFKQELVNSRIHVTQRLVEVINALETKPKVVISTSAVGFYAPEGCHDETHFVKGRDFLSDLCEKWEATISQLDPSVRLAITRFGVVMANKGGAFSAMALSSKLKVSTIIGSGKQAFSWIARADLIRAIAFILEHETLSGTFNFTTPETVTNAQMTQQLANHYHSFFTIHLPAWFFRVAIGEGASVVTSGQCALPKRLLDAGFTFEYPTFAQFLGSLN